MLYDYFEEVYKMRNLFDIPIPRRSNKEIVKAEQLQPDSRAARRQEVREAKRKWKVKYK